MCMYLKDPEKNHSIVYIHQIINAAEINAQYLFLYHTCKCYRINVFYITYKG